MRKLLVALVALESLALTAAAALWLGGALEPPPPRPPVFRPPLYGAVIGDRVRYQILRGDEIEGYVEYEVLTALEYEGVNLGREFEVKMTRFSKGGRPGANRYIRLRPRASVVGWLPPVFEDGDDYPASARPVVKSIEPHDFELWGVRRDGFLVEAVVPRESLTEVAQRLWITRDVPVFGVARWERGDEVLVVHGMRKLAP